MDALLQQLAGLLLDSCGERLPDSAHDAHQLVLRLFHDSLPQLPGANSWLSAHCDSCDITYAGFAAPDVGPIKEGTAYPLRFCQRCSCPLPCRILPLRAALGNVGSVKQSFMLEALLMLADERGLLGDVDSDDDEDEQAAADDRRRKIGRRSRRRSHHETAGGEGGQDEADDYDDRDFSPLHTPVRAIAIERSVLRSAIVLADALTDVARYILTTLPGAEDPFAGGYEYDLAPQLNIHGVDAAVAGQRSLRRLLPAFMPRQQMVTACRRRHAAKLIRCRMCSDWWRPAEGSDEVHREGYLTGQKQLLHLPVVELFVEVLSDSWDAVEQAYSVGFTGLYLRASKAHVEATVPIREQWLRYLLVVPVQQVTNMEYHPFIKQVVITISPGFTIREVAGKLPLRLTVTFALEEAVVQLQHLLRDKGRELWGGPVAAKPQLSYALCGRCRRYVQRKTGMDSPLLFQPRSLQSISGRALLFPYPGPAEGRLSVTHMPDVAWTARKQDTLYEIADLLMRLRQSLPFSCQHVYAHLTKALSFPEQQLFHARSGNWTNSDIASVDHHEADPMHLRGDHNEAEIWDWSKDKADDDYIRLSHARSGMILSADDRKQRFIAVCLEEAVMQQLLRWEWLAQHWLSMHNDPRRELLPHWTSYLDCPLVWLDEVNAVRALEQLRAGSIDYGLNFEEHRMQLEEMLFD
eukprot:PLAT4370.1.p1 GENE.PLAT4370.1~~PLAT4370.1.p1  ORF type:complete len:692 (+),score=201.23 PLAT4370.1:1407-3482(+)